MMICLCSLQDLGNLYYPKRTVILSFEQWEDFHQNIDDEPNAYVFTLKESKAKIKSVSHILLHLCTHLHLTEKTGNELLFFPWEKQRERLSSRIGQNDVSQQCSETSAT